MRHIFAAVVLLSAMCAVSADAQVPTLIDATGYPVGPAFPAAPDRFSVLVYVQGGRHWATVVDYVGTGRAPSIGSGEWDITALPYFSGANCTGNVFLILGDNRGSLGRPRLWVAADGRAYTHIEPLRKIAVASLRQPTGECVNQERIISGYKATFVVDLDMMYPLPLTLEF